MKDRVKKPTCLGCPHNLYYTDRVPKRQFGVMMQQGERFCTYRKRARKFKGRDPKVYVPSWCEKRNHPCKVRVYTIKSALDYMLFLRLLHDLGNSVSISSHRYALRAETTTPMTPQEFWEKCNTEPSNNLFDIEVHTYEVVEIDDGLVPIYFYKADWNYRIVNYFKGEEARQNELEDNPSEEGS